ncbi:MAG: VWA domain-containing protein, partial [Caldilineaceae bacterium]
SSAPAAPSSHHGPTPVPYDNRQPRNEPVTAGVVDDNEQWNDYLDYRARHNYLWVNERDISERITIQVWDENNEPVHDATVEIYGDQQQVIFTGRTDAGGRLFFHPRAMDYGQQVHTYFVTASKGYVAQRQQFSRQESRWTITLIDPPAAGQTQLDLLFLVDATGSMSDEIDKLTNSIGEIASQIDSLPERPSVRYNLVSYRDRGDQYVVKADEFTSHLNLFQKQLSRLRADGGGDYPEALNEALHTALHNSEWTGEDAVRLVILVADAPPHLDYQEGFAYDTDMMDAVRMGVKIFPVGASGLDEQGEYIFRQMAQFTGGKFVFLTYEEGGDPASGPGTETTHDVDNYSVDTLDRLVVRLVREELAKLPQGSRQQ